MPLGSFRLNGLGRKLAPAISFANATGGTTSTYTADGKTYRVHRFTSSGNFVVSAPGLIDFLLVGGGGGSEVDLFNSADGALNGGGAGGSTVHQSDFSVTAQTYSVTVGAAGLGGSYNPRVIPTNGGSTVGFGYTALGGGQVNVAVADGNGGGNSTSGSLRNGGAKFNTNGGGGAGAGGGGNGAGSGNAGSGGIGAISSITGSSVYYGGGGGGASTTGSGASGGSGGGGTGRSNSGGFEPSSVNNGTDELGGGAGGGNISSGQSRKGGRGGSGVVIVRYQIA